MTLTPTQSAPKSAFKKRLMPMSMRKTSPAGSSSMISSRLGGFMGGWMKLRCLPSRCSKSTPAKRCVRIAGCGRTPYGWAFQPDQRARVSMGSHSTRSK